MPSEQDATTTPPPKTSVWQERLWRNIVRPTIPSDKSKRLPYTTVKSTGLTGPMTVRTAKFSTETEKNPMTGKRKILPTVRIIKPNARRKIANSISYNLRQRKRKWSGRKPTRTLRNSLGLMQPIQPATAKCPNTPQTLSAPDENRTFSKTAALTPAADLHPIPTPDRRTALVGRTTIY